MKAVIVLMLVIGVVACGKKGAPRPPAEPTAAPAPVPAPPRPNDPARSEPEVIEEPGIGEPTW